MMPPVDYAVWLSTYFTGVLIFTCITMIEYAAVNFCTLNYVTRHNKIEETINGIRVNMQKIKEKFLVTLSKRQMPKKTIAAAMNQKFHQIEQIFKEKNEIEKSIALAEEYMTENV